MMYKMTDEAKSIFEKWSKIYYAELSRLQKEKGDPDYIEGWCIIDNNTFVKSVNDAIEILIYGYDDNAIPTVEEWIELYGSEDIYYADLTFGDVLQRLQQYYTVGA